MEKFLTARFKAVRNFFILYFIEKVADLKVRNFRMAFCKPKNIVKRNLSIQHLLKHLRRIETEVNQRFLQFETNPLVIKTWSSFFGTGCIIIPKFRNSRENFLSPVIIGQLAIVEQRHVLFLQNLIKDEWPAT